MPHLCPHHCPPSRGGGPLGGLVLIAAGVVFTASVVVFCAAHLELLAVCASVFAAVMGGVLTGMRRLASSRRMRPRSRPRQAVRAGTARPTRALPASPRRAIERPAVHLHLHGVTAEDVAAIVHRERP